MAATGEAADKRKKKKKEPESHPTVLTSVSPTSVVIRENKADRTVPITPTTEVYLRGQKANLAALQPGMAISITLAMDGDTASRINASDPPANRDDKDKDDAKDSKKEN